MRTKELEKETDVLRHIAAASDAIRQKHKMIKWGKNTAAEAMNEALKPVITPLEKLVNQGRMELVDMKKPRKRRRMPQEKFLAPWNPTNDDDSSSFESAVQAIDNQDNILTSTPRQNLQHSSLASSTSQLDNTLKDFSTLKNDSDENISHLETLDELSSREMDMASLDIESLLKTRLNRFGTTQGKKKLDVELGVRKLQDGLKIGDSAVVFNGDFMSLKEGKRYQLTPGLITLIFDKDPVMKYVTVTDENTYREIIESTNAHRKRYSANNSIRQSTSSKFTNIITRLFSISSADKKGGAILPQYMIAPRSTHGKIDYIYWDNPNELVERLRLLMASQAAGNTSHTNEIFSIIEELREAGIIY